MDAAARLEDAVAGVIGDGDRVTYDLRADRDPSKAGSTTDMTQAIVERL